MARALVLLLLAALAGPAHAAPNSTAARPPAAGPTDFSPAAGRCGVCHPAERVQFDRSRHAEEEVRCVSCHGGDDGTLDQRAAHGGGFRGHLARTEVPRLCSSCHSDETRMRPYNLPVDQYALYQTSAHGRRLAQGDTRVAVCTDCHRSHDVLPPQDPTSSVYALNIPRTCGTCHGDRALLQERKLRDVYGAYQRGVHGRELIGRGNRRAPNCTSCHGVHGAAPPNVGDVARVCGQCHTAERRYLGAGGHGAAGHGPGAKRPECGSCHDPHATENAQPERLARSCARCHEGQEAALRAGTRLWDDYQRAASTLDTAAALVERAEAIPIQTEDYRARLEEARTYLREALPAAHAVNEGMVAAYTTRASAVGEQIRHEIAGKLANLRTHRYVLILFWFYVLLTLYVLRRFRDQGPSRS
jgi:predicted CXXCH cytochrome family protein